MGWDCTFHLVDPKRISDAMGLLAGGKPAPDFFLAAYPEKGEAIWVEAQERVFSERPETAALLAAQLGILVAAAEFPHHAERGVAFSFESSDLPAKRTGPWLPAKYTADPAAMFKPLIRKRRELAKLFRGEFEHNGDTGIFIPAKHAAKAADVVMEAGSARFDGLSRTLRAAARHGLAFWEATDIGVPQTHPAMLQSLLEQCEPLDPEPASRVGYGSCRVIDGWVFLRSKEGTALIATDAPTTAPRYVADGLIPDQTARLPGGEWVSVQGKVLSVYAGDSGPDELLRTVDFSGVSAFYTPVTCPGGALLLPSGRGLPLLFDGSNSPTIISGLPPIKIRSRFGALHSATAATLFGDGTMGLMWNAKVWKLEPEEVELTEVMSSPKELGLTVGNVPRSLLPWGDEGFYFADRQTLLRASWDKAPERVARFPDLVEAICPGPEVDGEASLLVTHCRHPKKRTFRNVATLVFANGSTLPLLRGDFPCESLSFGGGYFWGQARIQGRARYFRLPASTVLRTAKTKTL